MKRIDLIKRLTKEGCVLIRHGGKHDWYQNTTTKMSQPVPRLRLHSRAGAKSRPGIGKLKNPLQNILLKN